MKLPKLSKKTKRLLFTALVALIAATLGLGHEQVPRIVSYLEQTQPGMYKVLSVEDGDTLVVRTDSGSERVRMIGVDTPEKNHPEKPVQCFAYAATAYTTKLIGENDVRLQADPLDDNRDLYGRLLRYVYLPDGTLVNQRIIEDGYGFAYILFPFQHKAAFEVAEHTARIQKRGLWNDCTVNQHERTKETNPAFELN